MKEGNVSLTHETTVYVVPRSIPIGNGWPCILLIEKADRSPRDGSHDNKIKKRYREVEDTRKGAGRERWGVTSTKKM